MNLLLSDIADFPCGCRLQAEGLLQDSPRRRARWHRSCDRRESKLAGPAGIECSGPGVHQLGDPRIALPADARGGGRTGHPFERRSHLADRDRQARQANRSVGAQPIAGRSCAWMKPPTALSGEITHIRVDRSTGQIDSSPFTGSLMIPLANDDAAALGPRAHRDGGEPQRTPADEPFRV